MTQIRTITLYAAATALLAGTAVSQAQPRHHHHAHHVHGYAPVYGYQPDYPGAIVARWAAQAQHEPGLTSELAPDSRQTASGGPVGGVPGFDGF